MKPLQNFAHVTANVRAEGGQTMAEYAVVLAAITIAVVLTLGVLDTAIKKDLKHVVKIL